MKPAAREAVHALVVPMVRVSLLIPSALVAEVVNVGRLTAVPLSPPWLQGVFNWRSRPVPVISFEALSGGKAIVEPRSKVVVFYPLQGRRPWEFFAVLATGEPQPKTFTEPEALSTYVTNNNPYLAVALQLDKTVVGIPDLNKINQLFYPAP